MVPEQRDSARNLITHRLAEVFEVPYLCLDGFEADYQELKAELLEAGAQDRLTVADMDARLRAASALRRAAQQIAKAARMLAGGAVPAHDPAPAMEKTERNVPH